MTFSASPSTPLPPLEAISRKLPPARPARGRAGTRHPVVAARRARSVAVRVVAARHGDDEQARDTRSSHDLIIARVSRAKLVIGVMTEDATRREGPTPARTARPYDEA